jgi:hypothetical protein
VVTIEFGGYSLIGMVSGKQQLTAFQLGFSRAGHAHAGVLVILSLVALLMADAAEMRGLIGKLTRPAIPIAAILMSAGFFLSSMGDKLTEPNGMIVLLYLGALSLTFGTVSLGIALIRSSRRTPDQQAPRKVTSSL